MNCVRISWTEEGWADHVYWQSQDKRMIKRINQLIRGILRNGYMGLVKPEPLKENLSGWRGRRIDEKHRLIYRILDGAIQIAQCRSHYAD